MDKKPQTTQQQSGQSSLLSTASEYRISPENSHPDPVLSRLFLNDQFGKPISNPKVFFRDCKVVGFFFSTIWKYDVDSFQNKVLELCNRNPHRFKCIYVSVDASKEEFDSATLEKSWVHMIWEDGSNADKEGQPIQLEKVEFITPEEQQLIKKIIHGEDNDFKKDTRPISRVGLCSGLNMMYAPTLAIYHLESKTWLEKNVSIKSIVSKEKREIALETWERGDRLSLSWMDVFMGLRWAILISVAGIIYKLLIQADDSYNLVHFVEKFLSSNNPETSTSTPQPSTHNLPSISHYNEF